MHRDLKPENLLVNIDQNNKISDLKLCDFGMACNIYRRRNVPVDFEIGTVGYIAPEVLKQDTDYNEEIDSWSLGVILYQLVTGKLPFRGSE